MQLVIIGVPYTQKRGRIEISLAANHWQEAGLVERLAPYVEQAIWVSLPPPPAEESEQTLGVLDIGRKVAATVKTVREAGAIPLILGGDGLLNALGTIIGLENHSAPVGIAWLDAHSNLAHNQMLSLLAGWGDPALAQELGIRQSIPEWHILLAGVRELLPSTNSRLENSLMTVWTAQDLQQWGKANELGQNMLDWPPVYLHLDLSVLDPKIMPAVQDPQPDGLTLQTLVAGIESIAAVSQVVALSVGNFVPDKDQDEQGLLASMQVIEAAVRIIAI